jgi:hypothetical protein
MLRHDPTRQMPHLACALATNSTASWTCAVCHLPTKYAFMASSIDFMQIRQKVEHLTELKDNNSSFAWTFNGQSVYYAAGLPEF